jgi:hypothetical protein
MAVDSTAVNNATRGGQVKNNKSCAARQRGKERRESAECRQSAKAQRDAGWVCIGVEHCGGVGTTDKRKAKADSGRTAGHQSLQAISLSRRISEDLEENCVLANKV